MTNNVALPIFLTVIIPVYNEHEVLKNFHSRLNSTLISIHKPIEILYVDDGSQDASSEIIMQLKNHDLRISYLALSRNFGKEIALTAGLNYAQGEFVIIMDADLQHPPELIPQFIQAAQQGYDIVYARPINRQIESWIKRMLTHIFYKTINSVANIHIPSHASDFRLLSRRAIEAIQKINEQHRFMKGLFAWVGYPQKSIDYKMDARFAGKTKWSYLKLWNFAIEGITSFTIMPLKLASYLGLITAFIAFLYGVIIISKTILFGDSARGYPSLMVVVLFLGSIQLFSLGIIGEYLGRTFNETKNRPLYFIKNYFPNNFDV
ncbi:MAG TPA: glycosyltransferase family 2 protein [Candidatus Aquirickettsiella sp.]|jgi:glycosyltransferase involved in cell wall biosynthesis